MLRQLVSGICRAVTPIGLSAALIVMGCEASSQPHAVDPAAELRAGDDGPSAAIVAVGDEIADAIVADPAFGQLVDVAAAVVGDLHDAQQALPDEDLEAIALTTTHPSFAEVMGPGALLDYLGGNADHLDQISAIVDQIRLNHGLQDASSQDVRHVFELALATDEAHDQVAAALADELPAPGFDPCVQACHNAYVAIALPAMIFFVLAMVVAAATFPFGILLAQWAVAQLNRTLAEAQAVRDECIAACDGIILDIELCGGDDVCQDDEYCWKGAFGIGNDECRPKKDLGKVCSSHEKCKSGCCKYNFASNPVSKTCRPANKCN